ncbi:MAG: hypothetical protein ACRENF_05210, partial [Thermodesulfobacteriota bacterium]
MGLDIDSINEYGQDRWCNPLHGKPQTESLFHEAIFSASNHPERFSRSVGFDSNRLPIDHRVESAFRDSCEKDMMAIAKSNAKGEVKAEVRVD